MLALLELPSKDVVGRTTLELKIWSGPLERQALIRRIRERGTLRHFETRMQLGKRNLSVLANVEAIEFNELPCYLVQLVDITHRKRLENTLRLTAAAVEHSGEALVIFDAKGAILSVNPAFTRITGYGQEETLGRTLDGLLNRPTGRHDNAFFRKILSSLFTTGKWKGEIWAKHKSGENFPVLLSLNAIQNEDGLVINHVGVFTDISQLKRCEEALRKLALHDALTGLPNRSLLMDRGQHALLAAERHDRSAAVLFIDLDLFKSVNDTHGHATGDELLKLLAQRLLTCTRAIDTVARLGGDEFVIVLTELQRPGDAAIVAQKIIAELSKPFRVESLKLIIGASVGIASYPLHGSDMPTLLKQADERLYRAKKSGGNRYSM